MSQLDEKTLIELGQRTADHVVGASVAKTVEVAVGQDSLDQDAYFFSFLIDWNRYRQPVGELRIRLAQTLRDRLVASHDDHYPFVEVLSQTDWEKRKGA